MTTNLHLVLEADQWTGPGPAQLDGRLELQIARLGLPRDGWVPVLCGWRYSGDTGIERVHGVWVAADVLDEQTS